VSKPGAGKSRAGSGGRGDGSARPRGASRRRRKATDGLEPAADGNVIGQDPRRLSTDELRELGHRGKPLLQAMRRRCIDCCGGKKDEVRRCTAVACPLWPYRMGTDPWHPQAKPADEREQAQPAAAAPVPALAAVAAPVTAPAPATVTEPAATPRRSPLRRKQAAAAKAPLLPFLDDAPA
jgi:hypothetical protein